MMGNYSNIHPAEPFGFAQHEPVTGLGISVEAPSGA